MDLDLVGQSVHILFWGVPVKVGTRKVRWRCVIIVLAKKEPVTGYRIRVTITFRV
jgi:hypothetical protein